MDEGHGVSYKLLQGGTAVHSSDGEEVGTVERVLENPREHIFDGIVMRDPQGEPRFVDAPEVARTAERAVTLAITATEAAELPPPERAAPSFRPDVRGGRVSRLLRGGWRRS